MSASEWFLLLFFNYSCTWMLTFKKLFLFPFFPCLGSSPLIARLLFLPSFWLFTFCPLKLRPLWCMLGILAVQVQKKALLSNLIWHLCILAQSFAGLMGWLQMALSFSHCSPLCMRGTFCLFMWETLFSFIFGTIRLNLETSVILLNVPLSVEVYLTNIIHPGVGMCYHFVHLNITEMGGSVMELIVLQPCWIFRI